MVYKYGFSTGGRDLEKGDLELNKFIKTYKIQKPYIYNAMQAIGFDDVDKIIFPFSEQVQVQLFCATRFINIFKILV